MLSVGFFLLAPFPSRAADLHVTADTIIRGFDRQADNGKKLSAAPAYEYLQLDYGNLKTPGLSLHAQGWGRINLGDNYNNGDSAGQLLHAYLQYVSPNRDFLLRAGRQYIFEGVARDSIDGIYGKTYLIPSLSLSAFAGSPVALDTSNGRKGDYIFGAKLTHYRPGSYDLGVSYKYIADNGIRHEESLGADLTVLLPDGISLLGHSSFNLVTGGLRELSYEMRLPLSQFAFQPFFQHFQYSDYFNNRSNSANPFRFLQGTGNSLTVIGTEAFWYPSDHGEFVMRFKNYDYDKRFSSSQLYSLLAIWKWKILSEVGAEFGRMQGSEAENRYYQGRGYFFWNMAPGFITGDVMYINYDKAIYTKNSSLFTSVGGGTKFFNDTLSVKLSFDFSKDPYFDSDYRWMLKLTYLLDTTFGSHPRKN